MIDLRIKQLTEVELLQTPVDVFQKLDGVKLTLTWISEEVHEDFSKNWIVSYKGNILYKEDFLYVTDLSPSIGISQFKPVFEHLERINSTLQDPFIPGTEFFCEYIIKKPTLSSSYTDLFHIVLLSVSNTTYNKESIKFGKYHSEDKVGSSKDRSIYAEKLQLELPTLLFSGVLSKEHFEYGICDERLKQFDIDWDGEVLQSLKQNFLILDSKYGGKEEGVVFEFKNGKIRKFVQEYQHNKEHRNRIKQQYKFEEPKETEYWNEVHSMALKLSENREYNKPVQSILKDISETISMIGTTLIDDERRFLINFQDDVYLTTKLLVLKKLPGNNGAMFIGKFRIITTKHYFMIHESLKKYDNFTLVLVTSKETKSSIELREKMLKKCFPNLNIVKTRSGNLISIMNKIQHNVNVLVCGEDRIVTYTNQKIQNLSIECYERTEEDISATKIIENIDDFEYFKMFTPKEIHSMYDEIKLSLSKS